MNASPSNQESASKAAEASPPCAKRSSLAHASLAVLVLGVIAAFLVLGWPSTGFSSMAHSLGPVLLALFLVFLAAAVSGVLALLSLSKARGVNGSPSRFWCCW